MTGALDAVVFDLYGTLLHIGKRSIHREVPRRLNAPRDLWTKLVRGELLTRPFPDAGAFARFVAGSLAPGSGADGERACLESVRSELDSVTLVPGVLALLQFLKRRGLKLGLLSNLASPHKEPLSRFGLLSLFEAAAFSCDEGVVKPDPEIYQRLAARLGVPPERTLFVGDSAPNDVEAPAALGMRTAGIGAAGGDVVLSSAAGLGCYSFADGSFAPLLAPGRRLEIGGRSVAVEAIAPVPDDDQGRYNLVWALEASAADGAPAHLFAKRFLLPDAAHVEEFAYRLQNASGLPACEAAVVDGLEPLLVVTEAPGRKLEGPPDPAVAREIGRHFGFGFLFSNADLRPRNSFRLDEGSATRLTVVDLEHCLFNLAIDTSGLPAPGRPETFDRMTSEELRARVQKKVLSPKTSSRARKAFLGDIPRDSDVGRAYDEGFLEFFARQRRQADALCDMIAERIHDEPPLVIGTHAHRRAMASVDLEDIRSRLALEPEAALAWMW